MIINYSDGAVGTLACVRIRGDQAPGAFEVYNLSSLVGGPLDHNATTSLDPNVLDALPGIFGV